MSDEVTLDKLHVSIANKAAEFFKYGDVITKEWLMEHSGIKCPAFGKKEDFDKYAFEYLVFIEGFRTHLLLEHKMLLDVIKGKGYLVVTPKDQTSVAMAKMRKNVTKEINSGVTALLNINVDHLTDDQARTRNDALGKLGALSAFHKGNKNYLRSDA